LFGMLTVKPQLGLLLPIVLLLEWRWVTIAVAGATTVGLVGLSALVFGSGLWLAYLTNNFAVTRDFLEGGTGLFMLMAPSPFMAMRLYGAATWVAYLVQGACALPVVVGLVLGWRSAASLEHRVALTSTAALLVTPYAHNYDMTLISVAVL